MSPPLPPELWLEIISFAVYVPVLFDTEWHHSPDELIWEGGWARMEMTQKSLQTRRAIALVSRLWSELARRFVFENLVLERSNLVEALSTLFEKDADHDYEPLPIVSGRADHGGANILRPQVGFRHWVKRVEIKSDAVMFTKSSSLHVERLVRGSTKIRVLSISAPIDNREILPPLYRLLRSQIPPTLRRVSVARMSMLYLDSLFGLPNRPRDLYWITVGSRLLGSTDAHPPPSLSQLSALEIIIDEYDIRMPAWTLPSLRYFSVTGLTEAHTSFILPFMACNGPRLLTMNLATNCTCDNLHEPLKHATNLKTLILDGVDLASFHPPISQTHPTITHIGIAGSHYLQPADSGHIHQGLAHILPLGIFPNLTTIRLLAGDVPNTLAPEWGPAIDIAAEYGIRLENRHRHRLRYNKSQSGADVATW